jgi:lipopolysaccharide transport system ATP-binding protein
MNDPVICVEQLGKRYRLGRSRPERYTALRDVIADGARALLRGRHRVPAVREEFWALRDVAFEVERGEVLGIIGRNGAGKSTLLKILSRITEPTKGRVRLKGRVASLLEVGTGFHPELTGRENIFLNGAILGMSRSEIRRKFDAIVAFAEVDRFLDTPVKRFSSGMYVRLAFSVAAHLEPEILIVDEVLSVGDAEFQKKCLGKMHEVSGGGRTVLFVSHNMAAVQGLCGRAVYLETGRVRAIGETARLVAEYLNDVRGAAPGQRERDTSIGDAITLSACEIVPNLVRSGDAAAFRVTLTARESVRLSDVALLLYSERGWRCAVLDFRSSGLPVSLLAGDVWEVSGEIASLPFVEGEYAVGLHVRSNDFQGDLLDLEVLTVAPAAETRGYMPYPAEHRGVVDLDYRIDSLRSVGV